MNEPEAYLKFFALREQPFAPTADPAYFYATREHKECLFRLWSGIDGGHGIAVVLGSYGTGKTTLLRKLLSAMTESPERYCTAVIGSPIPSWTSFALLEGIVAQFGLAPARNSFVSYMEALNQHLLENWDRTCTLIIDDAQNLNKRGQLELLRLVQNLETQQRKLLNLVFFAQLEWSQILAAAPNFEQRINMTYTLEPIRFEDTRDLIEFRLSRAGATPADGPRFDEPALRAIHAYSDGSPRIIVTLCRNALLEAGQLKSQTITHEIILHTIDKTTLPDAEKQARVTAALAETLEPTVQAEPFVQAEPATLAEPASHAQADAVRELRAAQLLLKGLRDDEGQGGS